MCELSVLRCAVFVGRPQLQALAVLGFITLYFGSLDGASNLPRSKSFLPFWRALLCLLTYLHLFFHRFAFLQICLYFLENARRLFGSDHRTGAFELFEKIVVFKTRHDVEVQVVDDLASGGPAVVQHIYCVAVCGLKSQNSLYFREE